MKRYLEEVVPPLRGCVIGGGFWGVALPRRPRLKGPR